MQYAEGGRAMQEDGNERVNRELIELLNEIRVALPGVQVLFAFLLIVPFSFRYKEMTDFQNGVYFLALACAAIASVLLITPSALHRLNFRAPGKERLLFISNRLAIAGLMVLGLAMVAVMVLITDVLFGGVASIVAGVVSAALVAAFWVFLPIRHKGR